MSGAALRTQKAVTWFESQGLHTIRVHYPKVVPGDRPLGACSCGKPYKLDPTTRKPVDSKGLCVAPAKHPVDMDWNRGRRTTSADWDQAWNVGLMCGPEHGVMVLDVDVRNGGLETMSKLGPLVLDGVNGWDVNETFSYFTSGHNGSRGYHLVFKITDDHPDAWGMLETAGHVKGVDVKVSGMVVAVPSVHASGDRYDFRKGDVPIKTLDIGAIDHLTEALASLSVPISQGVSLEPGEATDAMRAWILGHDIGTLGEGERNNGMLPLVGALVKITVDGWSGASSKPILEMMLRDLNDMGATDAPEGLMRIVSQLSQSICSPPMGPEELGTMTHNILRRELEKQLAAVDGVTGMVARRQIAQKSSVAETKQRMSKLFLNGRAR